MTSAEKINSLAAGSGFDSAGPEGESPELDACSTKRAVGMEGVGMISGGGLCRSRGRDGRSVSLFKTLYTNTCSHECNYCMNASTCSKPSEKYFYTPEELSDITMHLYNTNSIEGLFLSSGTGRDENETMEKMIETTQILRNKHGFTGYVHLKVLPGSSKEHIKQAIELADRVSINIETPSKTYMNELSPTKDYHRDILLRQRYIKELSKGANLPSGQTTQMVVGAAGESDKEIFEKMVYEYREMDLRRVYYSVFSPLDGTGFAGREKQPLWREHRLYQADWLYRAYGMPKKEIELAFGNDGFLPDMDPKLSIARQTLDSAVDPNDASFDDLIKVPGIGPRSAERIINARITGKITRARELQELGVKIKRARLFLEINGWRDTTLQRWLT